MGSPETEEDREDDEALHKVKLSQGFWLANTVCTQALWEAVTGDNPIDFKNDDLPIKMVSWEDTKEFIIKINSLAENLNFRLPTETEWEYACRAGTEMPFSFGETISSEQVNFNGSYPYGGNKKSEYRRKSVAVRSLPCNDWGLFEMHGNVWEWCEDWYGEYEANSEMIIDPCGPNTGTYRVLRGGSNGSNARDCRSAYRSKHDPAYRADIGFRLVSDNQFTE